MLSNSELFRRRRTILRTLDVCPFEIESKFTWPGTVRPLFEEGLELSPPELPVGDSTIGTNPRPTDVLLGDVFFQNFDDDSLVSNGDRDRLMPSPPRSV